MTARLPVVGTTLSLFTGAGGLDVGLERAGLRTIACVETDELARRVLAKNRPSWINNAPNDVLEAAAELSTADLDLVPGQLDLIAGGPPCQPFSKAAQWASNSRSGMRDPRAKTVEGMLDLVETFLPGALLIENVAGFFRGPVNALNVMQDRLEQINAKHNTQYNLSWSLVDSADYGVAQHRVRAIGLACRDGQPSVMPPTTHVGRPLRAWDALHDLDERHKPSPTGYWSGVLPSIPEGSNYLHHTSRGGGVELFGWRSRYWSFLLKLAKNQPSWTLPASPGPSTGPFHWESRPLSVREQARLQSFPDSWRLLGTDREQRRLIGNATPPLLAEHLGRMLVRTLGLAKGGYAADGLDSRLTLQRPRRRSVPAPEALLPLDEKYLEHAGMHAAHPGTGFGPSPRGRGDSVGVLEEEAIDLEDRAFS